MPAQLQIDESTRAFRLISSDGSSVFDSRYATQKTLLTSVVDIGPGPTPIVLSGGTMANAATVQAIPYGKTFPTPPYVRSAGRMINLAASDPRYQQIKPPFIGWGYFPSTGAGLINGYYTNAQTNQLVIGNVTSGAGNLRVWFTVFDQQV